MKKVLGYGFKLSQESIKDALAHYDIQSQFGLCKTKKEVVKDIAKGKADGDIPKSARPKIFKVVVEVA